jgi:MFS family permease
LSFYGWRITWTLAVTQTVGYGVLYYAFSVFVAPMEAELGWSRAQTSAAFSLALLVSSLVAIPVGRHVDKHGSRLLMTIGSAAGVVLVLLWSSVESLTAFYFIQAAIGLVMAAVFYEVAFTVVAVWFRRHRARAMLIITMVAGFASTIFIPLTTYLVGAFGWRDALRLLALLLAVSTVPLHAFVLRHRPEALGLRPDGVSHTEHDRTPEMSITAHDAYRAPTFWWLSSAFALDRIALIAIAAHSVPLLLERGYSDSLVAAAAGSIGAMQVAGRLLFAPIAGKLSLPTLTMGVFLGRAVAFLLLLLVPGVAGMWLFAVLFGAANGATTLARASLVAELYGSAHYGNISGVMTTLIGITQTIAPVAVGALHDLSGSYTPALWSMVATSLLAALCVVRVSHPVTAAGLKLS